MEPFCPKKENQNANQANWNEYLRIDNRNLLKSSVALLIRFYSRFIRADSRFGFRSEMTTEQR
jgi:hypothetical protein